MADAVHTIAPVAELIPGADAAVKALDTGLNAADGAVNHHKMPKLETLAKTKKPV